ncbi:hypothetical protein CEXT_381551 [Caerostris extrusa]|uniref:Uncharacterized protein n=1 Tax=Caerostris extrusa TaxID=172846 RepID=A0AAV4WDA8_CAEEX|nr:hypothetical protein CEXT_381551 [Caerostris extrusa]
MRELIKVSKEFPRKMQISPQNSLPEDTFRNLQRSIFMHLSSSVPFKDNNVRCWLQTVLSTHGCAVRWNSRRHLKLSVLTSSQNKSRRDGQVASTLFSGLRIQPISSAWMSIDLCKKILLPVMVEYSSSPPGREMNLPHQLLQPFSKAKLYNLPPFPLGFIQKINSTDSSAVRLGIARRKPDHRGRSRRWSGYPYGPAGHHSSGGRRQA